MEVSGRMSRSEDSRKLRVNGINGLNWHFLVNAQVADIVEHLEESIGTVL